MKAIIFKEHGGPDKLEFVTDFPEPVINEEEVLIKVKACALNQLDIFTRNGSPTLKLPLPHIPGSDVSGVIEKLGSQVRGWNIGDRVVINPGKWCNSCEFCIAGEHSLCKSFLLVGEHIHGGYAEYLKISSRNLLKLPEHITFEESAGAALSLLTAYRMIIKRGRLRPGEIVLVIGASGGVSTFAIQLAKLTGAKVWATTSTDEKVKQAQDLGADFVINYTNDPDWAKTVYLKSGKRGVDMVVDSVGTKTWEKSLKTLRKGGRLVTCGGTTGLNGNTNIGLIFWNQLEIIGSTMSSQSEFIEAMQLLFDGKIKVPTKIFELQEARTAQEYMMNQQQFGKIVLKIN
jgi:NADPH:quinone reductase-like Zn-dependent oxidoreductase